MIMMHLTVARTWVNITAEPGWPADGGCLACPSDDSWVARLLAKFLISNRDRKSTCASDAMVWDTSLGGRHQDFLRPTVAVGANAIGEQITDALRRDRWPTANHQWKHLR